MDPLILTSVALSLSSLAVILLSLINLKRRARIRELENEIARLKSEP